MKRWAFVLWLLAVLGTTIAACGGTGSGSTFVGGPNDDAGADGTMSPTFTDGSARDATNLGSCTPLTCAKLGYDCGPMGDGCGGQIDCGACTAPKTCGGGGGFSVCGGNNGCVPKTCASQGITCGPAGDGCGGLLQCGSCAAPQFCGGGGPGVCGGVTLPDGGLDGGACVPETCASQAISCGPAGDGCGNLLACGNCSPPQTCGGGGISGACGGNGNACTPKTCAQLGFNCGPAGDGCGGLIQCGACTSPQICGASSPGVCGSGQPATDAGVFVTCEGGGVTTITGTVVAGTDPTQGFGQPDPIYAAYVYVPSGPVQAITTGATCDKCTTSQPAIVSAITGIDGTFTLTNPPVGPNVPVVIQLGKWRRVINVNVTACQANPLTTAQTHLPRNQSEGNIPLFAIDTGNVDVLECVLRKMGIQDTEFTNPNLNGAGIPQGPGRVQLYQASPVNGAGGAVIDNTTPLENQLFGLPATINSYDIVLFPCEGARDDELAANQTNVINYTNLGGRVFATHFSYVWLYNDAPFSGTATWAPDTGFYGTLTGFVDQTFPKGLALAQWLFQPAVGASATLGQIPVDVVRNDFTSVVPPSQRWMYTQAPDPAMPIHYSFNTPVGTPPNQQCGRVVYSDFHVENSAGSLGVTFPNECTPNVPMTPQEKLLEFMLFDLSSCISQDVPTCTPKTCAQLGYTCGPEGDGCGGQLACGTCSGCQACGGGGSPGVCGGVCCVPKTCAQQNLQCGPAGDGCGGLLQCGSCPNGQSCGGGGVNGVCGAIPDGSLGCTPRTCAQQNVNCGPAGDGCGGLLQCGPCVSPQTCGGGGVNGQCGSPSCTPKTCQQLGLNCGPSGDGCGGLLSCGTCSGTQTCGGGGTPGVCGGGIK